DLAEEQQRWIAAKLSQLRGRRTILLATHNLKLAQSVSDSALLLINGALRGELATEELFGLSSREPHRARAVS
ncbi:MAG TPA: hypothetical protein VMM92_08985, partial [Thermoanaerobaculia bacterium]|nr:hypothetical protein [Thermoanaerobaculia bacterium]